MVKKHRDLLEHEEQVLRATPGDGFSQPADVFANSVGHFWGILGTRQYMRARYSLVEAILKIKTFDAVKSALDHTMDILRLNRGDNMGVRDLVPALLLRLGRDQECYDFVKWYQTMGQDGDYDWGDMSLPFLNVLNADVFEPVEYMCGKWPDLSHISAIALLKIRLLQDLKSLQNSVLLAEKVPSEILHNVQRYVPQSTTISENKEVMDRPELYIEKLSSQVDMLYTTIEKANTHFWQALVNSKRHLNSRPEFYSHGSLEETQLVVQHSIDSWIETPGALEVIKAKVEG